MTDDQTNAEAAGPEGRPKRPPPTIDLEASEVSEGSQATGAGDRRPRSMPRWLATIVPILSGAAAALVVLGAVWAGGWLLRDATPPPEAQELASIINELSARVGKLESKPSAAASAPDNDLRARVDAHESGLSAARSDIAAMRKQLDGLAASINELKSTQREGAAPPDLSALTERLSRLEQAVRALPGDVRAAASSADDPRFKRVVVATALDDKVRRGEPFADALAAAKSVAPDAAALAPLDAFATSGAPTEAMLTKELLALLPQLQPPPATQEKTASGNSGWLDRLASGAGKLVRVERADTSPGPASDPGGTLRAVGDAARRNDLAAIRAEVEKLPPDVKARAQGWISRADARDAALKAAAAFSSTSLAALNKPAE